MFLAMDTVFEQCSVAVLSHDGEVLYQRTQMGKHQQTQQILPMIDEALKTLECQASQLKALLFNRGPGAFSGIRINTAVVQALSVAWDLPCVGVSSLQAIAQAGYEQFGYEHAYAVLDARMQQVYLGEYQALSGIMTLVDQDGEILVDYDKKTKLALPCVMGMTAQTHEMLSKQQFLLTLQEQQPVVEVRPDAVTIATLGREIFEQTGGVSAELALPVYLRNHAWKTLKEQGKAE